MSIEYYIEKLAEGPFPLTFILTYHYQQKYSTQKKN